MFYFWRRVVGNNLHYEADVVIWAREINSAIMARVFLRSNNGGDEKKQNKTNVLVGFYLQNEEKCCKLAFVSEITLLLTR